MSIESLKPLLAPRSIAVLGASENPNKIGGRPLAYLKRFGFKGPVWAINPTRPEVQGFKSIPSLDDLPEVPDTVVVAVPGDNAVAAVEACAKKGVKGLVCMTSGFGETSDPEGKAKEARMVAAARAAGMRMVGPNTQGLANFGNGAVTSFSTMWSESEPVDGPIAVVSQSGAMSAVPVGLLFEQGLGVRYSLATGNDADVSVLEMAAAAASDPAIKLLLLYIESIPRPDQLEALGRIAHARGVYVVALKAGRTEAGQRAALSHTGALANEDRVVDAALERVGIWRARNIGELVAAAQIYLKGWTPKGRRLVTISGSGATGVMSADEATFAGLEMVRLEGPVRQKLDAILPVFASAANPIDLTAALLQNNRLLSDILPVLANENAADNFMIGFPIAGQGYDVPTFARDTAAFADATGTPVVVSAWQKSVADVFKGAGVPTFPLEADAIAAMTRLIDHDALIARAKARPAPEWARPKDGGTLEGRVLNEAESLDMLARAGLDVVPHHLCRTAAQAATAWRNLGGPVAVKGCSADLPHKSEHGLVRLGLDNEDAVRAAFRDMEQTIAKAGASFDGVIVARMVRGLRELMIGAHRDAVFGPVVVLGDGGKYVEAMPDVRLLLPPFTIDDALAALRSLRCWPVLAGTRGEAAADVAAVARAAVAVGDLVAKSSPRIVSLDINPLIVGAEGYAIVDAVVVREER
ncbi:MAG: CoA-binding protein [Hyphomicrobium sp. SCN 65-11]|nr:MAG: CoA-binding protein [Hyphomicrobium sp. SCN 65-11]